MLKEELFFAIFGDYDVLKQKPIPRAREAFYEAKPYFELLRVEKQKVEELELKIKAYREEALNYKEMNQALEDRLRFHAELQRGGGVESKVGEKSIAPIHGHRFEGEAGHLESMLRGSLLRQSSPCILQQDSWRSPNSTRSAHDSRWPIYGSGNNTSLRSDALKGGGSQTSMVFSRFGKANQHGPSQHDGSGSPLQAPHICLQKDRASTSKHDKALAQHEKHTTNPFLNAVPSVKLVASEIDNLETYLRMYRDALTTPPPANEGGEIMTISAPPSTVERKHLEYADSVDKHEVKTGLGQSWLEGGAAEQEGRSVKPVPGHTVVMGQKMRRRKGVREARWRDFAIYLSRHPEACVARKEALQTVMEAHCVPIRGIFLLHVLR